MALHPNGALLAVLDHHRVLLIEREGLLKGASIPLASGAGFRGAVWSPDGKRLFVSLSNGKIQVFGLRGKLLMPGRLIELQSIEVEGNPRPGGMSITRDGKRLYVAVLDRNAVAEIDLTTYKVLREFPVENLPFEVKLSEDESTLVVSNWGGRDATDSDDRADSGSAVIVVDPRGSAATGTVCLINRASGLTKHLKVGLHPTAIAIQGNSAYVTNSASDSLSEIDLTAQRVVRTIGFRWANMHLMGSMPCALAIRDHIAFVCNGGDNAICEIDLLSGKVLGYRPAGFYPVAISLYNNGAKAYVLNTKGNGSVRQTSIGAPGNSHDFEGTITLVDLSADLADATNHVAANNGWDRDRSSLRPRLTVYNGAIQHVLYIIKENRTYDEVLGDMPQGNGSVSLCDLGERITPNQHALARQFCLFDNAYVSGTNSADGHMWCTQALANDYIEHFYTGYRTYPIDGNCAMSISSEGCLWNAALKKGKSLRDYGEFCDVKLASFKPKVKTWLEVWNDRISGKNAIVTQSATRIASLRPYVNPRVLFWPLLQSDQERADIFVNEYNSLSRAGRVPNLMILTLPCDHTEGRNPNYPKPQSMVADNDLALGRVVEAVSKSPQWKNTCIFVIEDDTQFGKDHVDGHRTVYFALSPYTRRGSVDHELCNTVSMIRSIELMLGLDPMNRFDALTPPLAECFKEVPDISPFTAVPNRIALDDMNPGLHTLSGDARKWTERSIALDWSGPDRADPKILTDVIWYSTHTNETLRPAN